jgi:DNA-binding NtrC family response regulator
MESLDSPTIAERSRLAGVILLVDDERAICETVKSMLEFVGFDVLTASEGRAALKVFSERPNEISTVLLDLNMPGMSGEEVLYELREIRQDVKVIVSSGFDRLTALERFEGFQPTGFIQKPYRLTQLLDELHRVINA